jgi:hypothetical protein
VNNSTITVPRGGIGQPPLQLDMKLLLEAEVRLQEVRIVNPSTAPELTGYFNEACNMSNKYLAWIEYEIIQAKKNYDLARAVVILEKSIDEYEKQKNRFKELGIKFNEDFREAMVIRDEECQTKKDTIDSLEAVKTLIEAKSKSFERAYYACRLIADNKNRVAASPNFSGVIGQTYDYPQDNFMGERKK